MGSVAKWLAYLHPDTAALGSIPLLPEMFSEEKIIDVLRLINGAGKRRVDSGLNILIKPILFWLVASQYYKKD